MRVIPKFKIGDLVFLKDGEFRPMRVRGVTAEYSHEASGRVWRFVYTLYSNPDLDLSRETPDLDELVDFGLGHPDGIIETVHPEQDLLSAENLLRSLSTKTLEIADLKAVALPVFSNLVIQLKREAGIR